MTLKTFWVLFGIAFIGFCFSFYNFTSSLINTEDSKLQEQRIEHIELELTKLQTSISYQKTIDSLHNSKELTNKKNK